MRSEVAYWPIATNFSLRPDVSFRGEAVVGGRQSLLPRSIVTRRRRFPGASGALV